MIFLFETTCDHKSLVAFYDQNGLETSPDPKTDGAFYSIFKKDGNSVIAAATLSERKGVLVLDYIAVDPKYRGLGLGEKALSQILEKARYIGAKELFITSKNPSFFEKQGFVLGEPEELDLNADCVGCPMLGTTCNPKNMKYILGEL